MKIINPITEEISEIAEFSVDTLASKISDLQASKWRVQSLGYRIKIIQEKLFQINHQKEFLAQIVSREMGKPFDLAKVEIERAISEAEYFLENVESWLTKKTAPNGYVIYEALGVVAVISPWNFPIMLPLRSIIPALLTGNSVVFKPSELSLQTGIEISKFFETEELMNSFFCAVGDKDLGKALVAADVKLIAFTGSTSAGKHIFQAAAQKIKHLILELGGLDSAIVLPDINLEEAPKLILRGNTFNSGQVCNAIKRVYVDRRIYQEFLDKIISLSKNVTLGDPMSNPEMGPLVSLNQLKRVQSFVDDAKEKGAVIHSGGKRLDRKGYFYPSTIITNVNHEMKLLREEAFGPLLPIIPVSDWQEAVQLSNAGPYGLSATIWTSNLSLAEEIATQLEVGSVLINTSLAGGPGTPWGGCKESGLGRQKTKEGLLEFCNTKYIKTCN